MKTKLKQIALILGTVICANFSIAQTTAMDFNRNDCNGNNQHLFNDLDAGQAVILEFFMNNCSSCVIAGQELEAMKSALLAQYPGKIKSYALAYTNSYSTTVVKNWVINNSFSSIPMDSGAAQVAYYGGFGMPTIVILGGGTGHLILGSPYIGFSPGDTTQMAIDIRNFLNSSSGINSTTKAVSDVKVFPNPATESIQVSLTLSAGSVMSMGITDVTGKQIENVTINESVVAGEITKKINVSHLPKGTYILVVRVNGNTEYKKFTVSK